MTGPAGARARSQKPVRASHSNRVAASPRSPARRRSTEARAARRAAVYPRNDSIPASNRHELLIDCEEDRTLRAVLVGMLRESEGR